MEIDKTTTPEKHWDKVKNMIFSKGIPQGIDEIIQKGFEESADEDEKWLKLTAALVLIKKRFG